ncbi:MAG: ATP-binding protein [Candidatus Micrarchaeota archaeon]|nr:ATP-binding protein [Candidatus Micrarchaeota archaeon]MDE1847588.1 ATP-binding protein [Candidatus Micrarchaeota archaeon]MDE1864820.1 ATP-binding protein [Candidatus Micrarchaeota archaeon]
MLHDTQITGSLQISRIIGMPYSEEPTSASGEINCGDCVYVGKAKLSLAPFFLNVSSAINPHIFVFGITGSGKSYLLKSLAVRMSIFMHARVLVIDLTGERRDFLTDLNAERLESISPDHKLLELPGLSYMDFSVLSEAQKQHSAKKVLESISELMRKRGVSDVYNLFLVLDEAWKVLQNSDSLEILIREGRKYGVGVIMASQIISDISEKFLSNISTVFVFRIQDTPSLERLCENYGLLEPDKNSVQNLNVGGCLVIQLHKDNKRSKFFIDKVAGVKSPTSLSILIGVKMELEIKEFRLKELLAGLPLGQGEAAKILGMFESGYALELSKLITGLIRAGADRRKILYMLREIKVSDQAIAEAFAISLNECGLVGKD